MELVFFDWLVGLADDQQSEIGRPGADPEGLFRGDYAGEQPAKCSNPLEVGLAVVRTRLEKGDSSRGSEHCGVMELQPRIRELCRSFGSNCLPRPSGSGRAAHIG